MWEVMTPAGQNSNTHNTNNNDNNNNNNTHNNNNNNNTDNNNTTTTTTSSSNNNSSNDAKIPAPCGWGGSLKRPPFWAQPVAVQSTGSGIWAVCRKSLNCDCTSDGHQESTVA
jgi:hypothetical protein|mmetsp:Transcript_32656/g.53242  ORF Transcript_32656/g.53242 Transcript_32656/m.53242 type:complete len:113 (+) Transcript_32656:2568-2906(+)